MTCMALGLVSLAGTGTGGRVEGQDVSTTADNQRDGRGSRYDRSIRSADAMPGAHAATAAMRDLRLEADAAQSLYNHKRVSDLTWRQAYRRLTCQDPQGAAIGEGWQEAEQAQNRAYVPSPWRAT